MPPLIVNDDVALVNPKLGEAEEVLPAVFMLMIPADMLKDAGEADVISNLLAKFMVPPSMMKLEVLAPLIALPVPVPTL